MESPAGLNRLALTPCEPDQLPFTVLCTIVIKLNGLLVTHKGGTEEVKAEVQNLDTSNEPDVLAIHVFTAIE